MLRVNGFDVGTDLEHLVTATTAGAPHIMMRTCDASVHGRAYDTVKIDDAVLHEAKLAAARTGRTLSQLVDDGLRLLLAQPSPAAGSRVTLPVFGGSGLCPGVDLEDKEGLKALVDDLSDVRAAR